MIDSLTATKILLSLPIGIGLAYPFFDGKSGGGILGELSSFGPAGAIFAVVFLILVYCYARDLKRCLERVSVAARKAKPNSVWLMFLIPYNFVEDFFIIRNVSNSLKAEAAVNPQLSGLRSFGRVSGMGWCAAQILSLVPNMLGTTAGVLAILFWAWHWAFVRRANGLLNSGHAS